MKMIEQHVEKILQEIDGSKGDKADLYEELTDHLRLSTKDGIESGLTEKAAVEQAIEHFGNPEAVGSQIQAAMYPFRKMLLLSLATVSLLYAYAAYLYELFVLGDAPIAWLLLAVSTSSLLFVIALQVYSSMNRKAVLNFTLIIHTLIYLFGLGSGAAFPFVAWTIIGGSIGLIYRTTIVDHEFTVKKYPKQVKWLHVYNITLGLIVSGFTLFFVWSFLAFSTEFTMSMLLFFLPLFIWLVTYYAQIKLVDKGQLIIAIFIGLLPLAIAFIVLYVLFFDILFSGVAV